MLLQVKLNLAIFPHPGTVAQSGEAYCPLERAPPERGRPLAGDYRRSVPMGQKPIPGDWLVDGLLFNFELLTSQAISGQLGGHFFWRAVWAKPGPKAIPDPGQPPFAYFHAEGIYR